MNTVSHVTLVTPEMAIHWLDTMQYEHQRKVRDAHVALLARSMQRGSFSPGTQITIARLASGPVLVDGQHRLWAVVQSNAPQVFTVTEHSDLSDAEAARMYGYLDTGLRRKPDEIYRPLGLADQFNLTHEMFRAFMSAIPYLAAGAIDSRNGGGRDRDEVMRIAAIYAPAARAFSSSMTNCHRMLRRPLLRASTVVLAVLSFRWEHPKTAAFWSSVAQNTAGGGDPARLASDHLISSTMRPGDSFAFRTRAVSSNYSIRALAACYNAYCDGRVLKLAKVVNDRAPLAVRGVPLDVEAWVK